MLNKPIKYGIECPKCHDRIFSFYRHDFRWCKCKNLFIDGGDDYTRMGGDINNAISIIFCDELDIIRK